MELEGGGTRWSVSPLWRLIGAGLVAALLAASLLNTSSVNFFFRLDARLIDQWQRLSAADQPSGEVVVVGIDSAAIRHKGRWPWARSDLADLVERIAAAGPRSLTLDILLTEPGPYSEANLIRTFRQNGPEVIALLGENPEARLAAALRLVPTALAVAGGSQTTIDELPGLTQCADPELLSGPTARSFHVDCLLFPLPEFEQETAAYAVTFAEQDLDGIIRRARAFVSQPYRDEKGEVQEAIMTALPVAALTACGANSPHCFTYDPAIPFLTEEAGNLSGYRLPLTRAEGTALPEAPLTPSFGMWLDFGSLAALGPQTGDDLATDHAGTVSAASLFEDDADEIARLADRHVILGLTRLGAIDQHTTPMATETATPGVLIQALAADNLIAGRVLEQPPWGSLLTVGFMVLIGALALVRFGVTQITALGIIGVVLIIGPIFVSWAAFEFGGLVVFGATPALAAFLGGAPVVLGRIISIRRDLADARESGAREEERMDAAREIQLGSLPFDADFRNLGFETASLCRPAQEVGGDFFELFRLSDGRLFAAVGDVSGKGLEASLVTALSKSISGAVTDRVQGPLGHAFGEVSREFVRQAPRVWRREKGGFVTLVAARIDPKTGAAEFAAAGCEPPTVLSANGTRREVSLPAVAPLGWIEEAEFETASITLQPGDTIVMFTDGVTEAETPDGQLFEQDHAEDIAAEASRDGAVAILNRLEAAVLSHQAGGAPTDDTTILAITWHGPAA
ncbi:MAG: CHASE2 domain-containing protein [Pseudomonadota bacterium]